jgi:hypothetical protein
MYIVGSVNFLYRSIVARMFCLAKKRSPVGFLSAGFQDRQQKGQLVQPIVKESCLDSLTAMLNEAGTWLEQGGRKSMSVEIPGQ